MYWKKTWWIAPISLIAIAYYLSPKLGELELKPGDGSRREFSRNNTTTTVLTDNCEHISPWNVSSGEYFVCRGTYALSMNSQSKMADWVAYCVDKNSITSNGEEQDRDWEPDPNLPGSVQLEPNDYRGVGALGYDRGHQAPLATFRGQNWQETNYTSNITPQKAELNRGAWLKLENYERSLIREYGNICTITGPYYQNGIESSKLSNADEAHIIPSGYWKIIKYGDNKIEGYLYAQDTPRDADFKLGAISIDEIERFTGFEIN
ncbi:MAG: DNA/RNA non-specific endonuclease [Microcoleaceae cyanobacterium]